MINRQLPELMKWLKINVNPQDLKRRKILLNGKKFFLLYDSKLKSAIPIMANSLKRSAKLLKPKTNATFVVVTTTSDFIKDKMGGVEGLTDDNTAILQINPKSQWKRVLAGSVAHEFNHTVRFGTVKYENLREHMAAEGLAQNFVVSVGAPIEPWSKALSKNKAKAVLARIRPHLNDRSYKTFSKVFFGSGDRKFPHWGGYTVSYLLVKKRLSELGADWNRVMKLSAKELIRL